MQFQMQYKGTEKWLNITRETALIGIGRYYRKVEVMIAGVECGTRVHTPQGIYRIEPRTAQKEEAHQ